MSHENAEGIRLLGTLTPDADLVSRVLSPGFTLNSFDQHAAAPPELRQLLLAHGYELDESIEAPTLVASRRRVGKHQDYQLTAVWTLLGADDQSTAKPSLVSNDVRLVLETGSVLVFDAWQPHSLELQGKMLWAVLSAYVKVRKK